VPGSVVLPGFSFCYLFAMDPAAMETDLPPAKRWVIEHDDRWLWTILYISSAVVLSIWISLFWLIVVVGVHGFIEWLRQRHFDPRVTGVVARVLWELKLDIALVLLALAVAVYTEVILGAAGLSGAARVGAQAAARGGAWAKVIRGVLLSIDDAAQLARAAVRGGQLKEDDEPGRLSGRALWGGWTRPWGLGGWISMGLAMLSVALILLAPAFTDHDAGSTIALILEELHPWPNRD